MATAIREPEKETEPITIEKTEGKTSAKAAWSPKCSSSEIATSAAAPPPTPLKRATICGMAVRWTRRAETAPATDPTAIPAPVIRAPAVVNRSSGSVAARAISMPAAAVQFPLRAPRGELSCLRPRMKRTAASR